MSEATDVRTVVSQSVVALRRAAGLTQAELADSLAQAGFGWTRTTVAEIETAVRSLTIEELIGVSSFFEVPPAFVLAGAGLRLGAIQIGDAELSRQELIDLVTDTRGQESAPSTVRKAIDRIWGTVPRRWADLWRRRGWAAGQAFAVARDEQLATRDRFPGPTYVLAGIAPLDWGLGFLWGTESRLRMQPGVPYVARDEGEAERLAELEALGLVRRIKPYEAYRMRQRGKQR